MWKTCFWHLINRRRIGLGNSKGAGYICINGCKMKRPRKKIISCFLEEFGKTILLQVFLLAVAGLPGFCNYTTGPGNDSTYSKKNKNLKFSGIREQLQAFFPLESGAEYRVTVCADLPDNDNPACVYRKKEPGHVFFILSKRDLFSGQVITRSFGFYPRVPVSCLFKQVRSVIQDNSNREYNASVEKNLSAAAFGLLLENCKELAKKKYNLNRYNCYDYVIEAFNSLPGIEKLPVNYVKFPFIFGRGGSPCGLYRDLKKLASGNSEWSAFIRFGLFMSPASDNP